MKAKLAACLTAFAAALPVALAHADSKPFVGPDVASETPIIIDSIGELETSFRALSTVGTKDKPSRWRAKLTFFVRLKDIATDDVVMVTVKKGKKRLGKAIPCQPTRLYKEYELAFFDCEAPGTREYDKAFSTKGTHTIELTFRKVIEGIEHKKFASFTVEVEELKKGAANNPSRSWAANHDGKLLVSTVEEKTESAGQGEDGLINNALHAEKRSGIPYLSVHTWFKREKRLERTKITCMHDGKRIAEGDSIGGTRYDSWSYKKKGKSDRRNQAWTQARYRLYNLHPRPGPKGEKGTWATPQHWMNENPGEYKCVITGKGEIIKELTFTVGKDGELVKPACQLASVNTLRTVTLVASKDKKLVVGDANLKRAKKTAYEGRAKWAKGCPLAR